MIKNPLLILFILLSADIITTFYGVVCLGATEINPICGLCGSLHTFFILKICVAIIAIGIFIEVRKEYKSITNSFILVCCICYSFVFIWNVKEICLSIH